MTGQSPLGADQGGSTTSGGGPAKAWLIGGLGLVAVAAVVAVALLWPGSRGPAPVPTAGGTTTADPVPADPDDPPQGVDSWGDGVWEIGPELSEGLYRAEGGPRCLYTVWRIGEEWVATMDTIQGDLPLIVELDPDVHDVLETSGCGQWRPLEDTFPAEPARGFDPGGVVIGRDVEPGAYRATNVAEWCWWTVSADASQPDEQDRYASMPGIAEFEDGQLVQNGCGTWVPVNLDADPQPVSEFDDGAWLVGLDVRPGRYEPRNPGEFCKWERRTSLAVLDRPFGQGGTQVVDILPTDLAFVSGDCGGWRRIGPVGGSGGAGGATEQITDPLPMGTGLHMVGEQVAPGMYDVPEGCYFARLSGISGESDDIIANGQGPTLVEVSDTDEAFQVGVCEGEVVPFETVVPDKPATSFGDGGHLVGVHIQPGTYRVVNPVVENDRVRCFAQVVAAFTHESETDFAPSGSSLIIEISEDDVGFSSFECGQWELVSDDPDPDPVGRVETGTWIVGVDILPGTYVAESTDSCYWERLADFGPDATLANSFEDQTTVEIKPTDAGFHTEGCGTWTLQE